MRHVVPAVFSVGLCLLLVGCSKGGLTGDDPQSCRRVNDPEPVPGQPGSLPRALYAELRHSDGSVTLPVMLEGIGGSYSGQTRPINKCDPPGTYHVERIALVDAAGAPVATVVRSGSSYIVTYARGGTATVSSSSFTRHYAIYSQGSSSAVPQAASLSAGQTARQGDRVTVSATAMAADGCGMRDMQFWLTTSPGAQASPMSVVTILGGQGSGTLRISPDLPAGIYYLEGRLRSTTGRYADLRRRESNTEAHYSLYNPVTSSYMQTNIPVVRIEVTAHPNADRTAPQPVRMEARPPQAGRCQQISLSLQISDDQGLPPSQQVTVRLGPIAEPNLLRATLTGGELLVGLFTVPLDAPSGVWLGYPETVQDAAGNVATGNLSGDKFTLNGAGISTPRAVPAAIFLVQADDMPPTDMGTPSDLSVAADMVLSTFPATLANINVTPMATAAQPLHVTITWMDNAHILK